LLPFPTAVLSSAWRTGDSSDRVTAAVLFGLLSIAISAAYMGLCIYFERRPELLVGPSATGFLRGERRRGAIAIVGTVVATVIAFVAPLLALVLFAVTPAFYLLTVPRTSPDAGAVENPDGPA
jgi:ABC-type Fe3+ transport system permease subunit